MPKIKSLTLLGAVFFAFLSPSKTWADCPDLYFESGNTKAYSFRLGSGDCVVGVLPLNVERSTFRQYLITDAGLLMVFNSTQGAENVSAGARNYFLFPRTTGVSVRVDENGDIAARTPSGRELRISSVTSRLLAWEGGRFREESEVLMTNQGGVELLGWDGLFLDTGWRMGNSSYADSRRKSVFQDRRGERCVVKNSEVFDYSGEDPRLLFATDRELGEFLIWRCPKLDISWVSL